MEKKYAPFALGGVLRCCAEQVPVDPESGQYLAGEEGEHHPCQYCRDRETSGVRFHRGVWQAGWISVEKKADAGS